MPWSQAGRATRGEEVVNMAVQVRKLTRIRVPDPVRRALDEHEGGPYPAEVRAFAEAMLATGEVGIRELARALGVAPSTVVAWRKGLPEEVRQAATEVKRALALKWLGVAADCLEVLSEQRERLRDKTPLDRVAWIAGVASDKILRLTEEVRVVEADTGDVPRRVEFVIQMPDGRRMPYPQTEG